MGNYEDEAPTQRPKMRLHVSNHELETNLRWFHRCRGILMEPACLGILDMHNRIPNHNTMRWARRTLYQMARDRHASLEGAISLIGCLYSQMMCASQWPHYVMVCMEGERHELKFLRYDWSRWMETKDLTHHPMKQKARYDR